MPIVYDTDDIVTCDEGQLLYKNDIVWCRGLIFTYMCAFDEQEELDYLTGLIELFESNGAKCCVVELCADFDVRLVRNKSENRLLYKESKRNLDWSEAEMRSTSEKYRLNSYEGEELPFKNYMKLDNTNIAPVSLFCVLRFRRRVSIKNAATVEHFTALWTTKEFLMYIWKSGLNSRKASGKRERSPYSLQPFS